MCNSKTRNRDVNKLDRWLRDLLTEEPVYFWFIAIAVGFVLIIIPLAIFHLLSAIEGD